MAKTRAPFFAQSRVSCRAGGMGVQTRKRMKKTPVKPLEKLPKKLFVRKPMTAAESKRFITASMKAIGITPVFKKSSFSLVKNNKKIFSLDFEFQKEFNRALINSVCFSDPKFEEYGLATLVLSHFINVCRNRKIKFIQGEFWTGKGQKFAERNNFEKVSNRPGNNYYYLGLK